MPTSNISPQDFKQFFDISRDLLLILDRSGIIHMANPMWKEILGYENSELVGHSVTEFMHPADVVMSMERIRSVKIGERLEGGVNRYRTKDGRYRVIQWNSSCVGELLYSVGSDTTDVIEVKDRLEDANRRMHNALQLEREARALTENQQERFRDLFAQAPMIAVVFSGPDQVIELANPSFYTLVNYRNLMGRPVREAIDLDETTSKILANVYRTGDRFVGKNFKIKADWAEKGRPLEKLFHCIFEPIRGRQGQVEVIWCLLFDVTETLEMEAKLRSAERMASLGEMAAGIAHEINNPLAYTLISLELINAKLTTHLKEVPKDMRETIENATEGVERVQNIVKGLKSFSRNDESRLDAIDLRGPITAAVNFTSNETRHRANVTTEFLAAPKTLANEGRLTQVLINLIVNSAQAIEPGRANEHRIHLRLFTSDKGHAAVEVSDTGCGISPEQLDHVFEPFFTSKPVGEGTGLGLSICHGIVTGYGGEIQVTNADASGTLVRVTMPAAPLQATAAELVEDAPVAASEQRGKRKILVVDDDRSLRDVIVSALEDEHDVIAVESAIEALSKLGQAPIEFDWIVCDVMMPQMTGMEFFERIKSRADGSEKKIILMTGGAFTPAVRGWMDELSNPKLEKPFRIRQLKQLIES